MSNPKNIDPFDNEFEDKKSGDSLLSTRDLSGSFRSESEFDEDFQSTFSVPKFDTKSKKYDKSFIESEDLEDTDSTVEISKPSESSGKAEVYINRRKNGELESIEVVASNGERILIRFEIDEEIDSSEDVTDESE